MSQNNPEMAGPTQPPSPDETNARQVFPVLFEKDYLDFTGTPPEDEPVIPKASSAPVSVTTQTSVTGLEDLLEEDQESPVQTNAVKDSLKKK